LDASFTFELGTFGSFIPTLANANDWLTNWKVFDRAIAPGANGWNPGAGYVASEATLLTDFTSNSTYASSSVTFAAGEQVYIWTYNTLVFAQGAEWALITNDSSDGNLADNWVIPEPECCGASVVEFRIEDASTPIVGGENDDRGPGTYTNDPPSYQLQTASVPEPGAGFLLGALALAVGLRRRR